MLFEFLQNNIGSIVVGLVLAAVVIWISVKLVSDKKKGKSNCGCSCSSCPNSSLCHAADKKSE